MNIFAKITSKLNAKIKEIFSGKIDNEFSKKIEEFLIEANVGLQTTRALLKNLKQGQQISQLIEETLLKVSRQTAFNPPQIFLVCGINGSGKTNTIAKLANYFIKQKQQVLIASTDTFRAAAIEQLAILAEKTGATYFNPNLKDPAAIAYKAAEQTFDTLLLDTSGRMSSNQNLMDELKKIHKVILKANSQAVLHKILILDSSTGHNAFNQAEIFNQAIGIDGLVVTKLDLSSKAGIIIGLVDKYKIPVYFLTTGQNLDDLHQFDAKLFIKALFNDTEF